MEAKNRTAKSSACTTLYFMVQALLLFTLLSGCTLFRRSEPPGPVPVAEGCRSGDILHDLQRVGAMLISMDARARIQLEINGKRHPSVSCTIKWSRSQSGERMRITGSGPFGITFFDALLKDTLFLLYIPSHHTVYTYNLASSKQGQMPETDGRLDVQARMILDPWSALTAGRVREISCRHAFLKESLPPDTVCYASFFQGNSAITAFSIRELTPVALDTRNFYMRYSGTVSSSRNSPPCLKYPEQITLALKQWRAVISIDSKEITFNTIYPDAPSFDQQPFREIPTLPLEMLLHEEIPL